MPREKKKIITDSRKMPPQNVEAEQSVLGSVLLSKYSMVKVADKLSPADFYEPAHEKIYESMLELYEKRQAIDVVTLTEHLEKKKALKEIGGASYITRLSNIVPSAAHVVHYAKIVRDKGVARRLIEAADEIAAMSYDQGEDVEGLLDKSEQLLFSISQVSAGQNFVSLKEILAQSFEKIDEMHKNKNKVRGVPTGFKALDNILSGFQPSDLVILAARPSMGKTSLALNIAEYVAAKEKKPVAVFSLEQSKEQLVDRMLSSQSQVDSWKLRTGKLTDDDFSRIGHAMGILSEAPIYIDDQAGANVMELRAKARRLQMEHGIGLIIIDYLQLMSGSRVGRGDPNRVQEISEISRGLKMLARELNVPVIALSQLSRAVEHRPDKRPMLSDLRESGSIEQDADVVMFIYRDEYYNPETEDKSIAEILIRKHRNGPVGTVKLFFVSEQTKFENLDESMQPGPEDM